MMFRPNKIIAAIGAIMVIITLITFFLITENRTALDWNGLLFILIAELGSFVVWTALDKKAVQSASTMLRSGMFSVLSIYVGVTVILSVVFLSIQSLRLQLKLFMTVQIAVIAVTFVVLLLLMMSARFVAKRNDDTAQAVAAMHNLMNRVLVLKEDPNHSEYTAQLEKMYDALKYSDCSSSVETDDVISGQVKELELLLSSDIEHKDEKVNDTMAHILSLITQRTSEVKTTKNGRL